MSIFALSITEAAQSAAIPRSLLEGLIALGQRPKARKIGNRVLILREDFEVWLKSLPETNLVDMKREGIARKTSRD